MAFRVEHLPESVAGVLRVFYRRRLRYRLYRVVCGTLIIYLGAALLAMHLDRFLFLPVGTRLWLFRVVHGMAALAALAGVLDWLLRRPTARQVAYDLEAQLPNRADERYATLESLRSAPSATDNPVGHELFRQLREAAERQSHAIRPVRLVHDARLRGLVRGLVLLLGLYLLLMLPRSYQMPLMLQRFVAPRANLPKPSFVQIAVTPRNLVLGQGGDAVIQAEIQGRIPPFLAWAYHLAGATAGRCLISVADGAQADLRVDPRTARELNRVRRKLFLFSQRELQSSFSYRLRCADAETGVHVVEVVAQPRLVALHVRAVPPAYTRLPPVELENPRRPVRLYVGSRVELSFTTDQPVTVRTVLAGAEEVPDVAWDDATRTGRYAFTLSEKTDLEVRVANSRGFANVERAGVSFGLLEDQSPTVRLDTPAADLVAVPGEVIPLRALAEDDLAIVEAAVRFQLNPGADADAEFRETALPLASEPGNRVELTSDFDLGQTSAAPGDELAVVLRVRDSGGNDGESRTVRIRVTAFTRGENERRRLAALRWFGEGLVLLDRQPPTGSERGLTLAPELSARLAAGARAAGVPVGDAPDLAALLQFLEREAHFTDAARHKEDLRAWHGVLSAAWELGPPVASEPPAATNWLAELATETLLPLVQARQLKNLTGRLFGMQSEIADLRARFEVAVADDARAGTVLQQALAGFAGQVVRQGAGSAELLGLCRRAQQAVQAAKDFRGQAAAADDPLAGEIVGGQFRPQLAPQLTPADEQALELLRATRDKLGKERDAAIAAATDGWTDAWLAGHREPVGGLDREILRAFARDLLQRILIAQVETRLASEPAFAAAYAAEQAAAKYAALGVPEGVARQATSRRAALYFEVLQELGAEVVTLAQTAEGLPRASLEARQADLNTAGYYLARGSLARAMTSCEAVSEQLARLLADLRPVLPALLVREAAARARLEARHRAVFEALAQRAADPSAPAEWRRRAAHWLDADQRLLDWNPHAPFWPRFAGLAVQESLAAVETPDAIACAAWRDAALAPPVPVAAAAAAEARSGQWLAWDGELSELLRDERIGAAERRLAVRVVAIEAAAADGAAGAARLQALTNAWNDLSREAADAPVPASAAAALRPLRGAPNDGEALSVLVGYAAERFSTTAWESAVRAAVRAAAAAELGLAKLAEGSGSSGGDDPRPQAQDALSVVGQRVEHVTRLLALDVACLAPLASAAEAREQMLVRLREAYGRYLARSRPAFEALALAGGQPSAGLGAELETLRSGLQTLQRVLQECLDPLPAGAVSRDYPILALFGETRRFVATATALLAQPDPAAVAAEFVSQSKDAGLELLAARSEPLDQAARSLKACEALLEQVPPDLAAYRTQLAAAQGALTAFSVTAAKAGAGELQETLRRGLAETRVEIAKLALPATASQVELRKRAYGLAALSKALAGMERRLQADTEMRAGGSLAFWGGPDGIWSRELRTDAEASRQRLLGQLRHARRRATLGILEGLEPQPRTGEFPEALAWSLHQHRLVRSPLAGAVSPPRLADKQAAETDNPLLRWLLDQTEEAAKEARKEGGLRNYPELTRELIDSMKDFLRY